MGRKGKNKSYELTIENTTKTIKLHHIQLPFPFIVDVRPEYTKDAMSCLINHSQPMMIPALYEDREKIIELMKKDGYYIKGMRPMTITHTGLCPQCYRMGIPKIEKKDTTDNRFRSGRYFQEKKLKKRPDEYWLTYDHKDKPHKCRIQQYQGSINGTYKNNQFKELDIRSFMIGYPVHLVEKSHLNLFTHKS